MSTVTKSLVLLATIERPVYLVVGALSGVAIHHGLFIHGEWHNQAPDVVRSYSLVFGSVSLCRFLFHDSSNAADRLTTSLVAASYCHVLGILASILVYRAFFHRLNKSKFPGPMWAKYTKIWQIWENRSSRNHLYLHDLHQKYGDVVRTGEFRPSSLVTGPPLSTVLV